MGTIAELMSEAVARAALRSQRTSAGMTTPRRDGMPINSRSLLEKSVGDA